MPKPKPFLPKPSRETSDRTLPLGDPERLGALLESLEPRLRAVAVRFTRDPETARDIVQNAFLQVLRHGDRFRGHSKVSTWLHRIVANEALMWLRAERRRTALFRREERPDERLPDPAPGPADLLALRECERRLRNGIASLPRDERDLVADCALSGLSYAEYGARHGLHPAAVKTRAFRARRRLERMLRPDEARPT